jgi:hypothetical protein
MHRAGVWVVLPCRCSGRGCRELAACAALDERLERLGQSKRTAVGVLSARRVGAGVGTSEETSNDFELYAPPYPLLVSMKIVLAKLRPLHP